MKNLRKTVLLALGVVLAFSSVVAQQAPPAAAQAAPADKYALGQTIPVDPRITVGQLPNGLRYWIRENREPKNRAELRLVVKAGSVLEDKDQLGLAHVVEHL
ncbi:MAG: insulinase family protein, partial [Candidatus Aminicenantales bacterium]